VDTNNTPGTTGTEVDVLEEIAAAHRMAAATGVDWRTALRAIRCGVDVIRTIKAREALRPLIAARRARTAA
jgi:hypothetical protein